jgi:septal ring-binding cell division protein DamX
MGCLKQNPKPNASPQPNARLSLSFHAMSLRNRSLGSLLLLACVTATLSACNSPQHNAGVNLALASYNAQHYDQAQTQATEAMTKLHTPQREEAAYLAGLSAYRLGRIDDAERHFMAACASPDTPTAAKAKAMLGEVRLDQHRPREAATLFSEAAPSFKGDDAKRCAASAAIAYQQSGDAASSKRWADAANGVTGAPSETNRSGFTLQVGAFKEKNRAQRAAEEAQRLAKREGLGEVRIIPRRDERGQPMYLVQFGSFPTREAAAAARAKIGRLQYIVAAAS